MILQHFRLQCSGAWKNTAFNVKSKIRVTPKSNSTTSSHAVIISNFDNLRCESKIIRSQIILKDRNYYCVKWPAFNIKCRRLKKIACKNVYPEGKLFKQNLIGPKEPPALKILNGKGYGTSSFERPFNGVAPGSKE